MSDSKFPQDVRRFLERHISSIEELEIVLFLHRHPSEAFTIEAVGRALQTDSPLVGSKLESLQHRDMVQRTADQGDDTFCFNRTSKYAPLIDTLAMLYSQGWRLAVTNIIYSKPLPGLQAFADAFDFRKNQED